MWLQVLYRRTEGGDGATAAAALRAADAYIADAHALLLRAELAKHSLRPPIPEGGNTSSHAGGGGGGGGGGEGHLGASSSPFKPGRGTRAARMDLHAGAAAEGGPAAPARPRRGGGGGGGAEAAARGGGGGGTGGGSAARHTAAG